MINIEPLQARDIQEWYDRSPPYTLRGFVVKVDGEAVAMYGVAQTSNMMYMFADFREKALKYRKTILKTAKAFVLQYDNYILYATADEKYDRSGAFLEHLGFENVDGKRLYMRLKHGIGSINR